MKNLFKVSIILIALFFVSRVLFFIVHLVDINDIVILELLYSFIYGIRYDFSVISYLLIPVLFFHIILSLLSTNKFFILSKLDKYIKIYFSFVFLITSIIIIVDLGFYFEFNSRLNYLVFDYMKDYDMILTTIINVYPYNILFLIIIFLIFPLLYIINKRLIISNDNLFSVRNTLLLIIMVITGIRGGVQDMPINLGTATFSDSRFINHLSMNPIWNFGYSFINSFGNADEIKFQSIKTNIHDAKEIIKKHLIDEQTIFIESKFPLLRKSTYIEKPLAYNVVIIIMESFLSHNIGVLGNKKNLTPSFDKLADEGLLFTRFFSSGTRTNRALGSILFSFPSLPRYKSILNDDQINQPFSSLASILKNRNYETTIFYAGNIEDDNINNFFSTQGYDNIYGQEIINKNVFSTPYGIADEHLYEKSKEIIKNSTPPYFLTLLNISNHQPYTFPMHKKVEHIHNDNKLSNKEKVFKYSDWALGEFMRWNKTQPDYEKTIYIVVGDHGYIHAGGNKDLSLDLSIYNVPCLIIGPQINPDANNIIASQVDIIPTLFNLLGGSFIHNSWGRNLIAKSNYNEYAFISPSGINHISGLISNEYFLIYNFESDNKLYSFTEKQNLISMQLEQNQPKIKQKMEKYLTSLIKLGIYSLNNYKCGIPTIR